MTGEEKACDDALRSLRMGEMIEFASNGSTAGGYLAVPGSATGPGVIVIQEWWGLVDHIEDVCDRFAASGFVALAPDLYHGQKVPLGEPDEAGKAMMAMKMDRAARDMSGAVDELLRRDTITLPVQVNGKKRADVTVARNAGNEDIEAAVLALDPVKRALDGKAPRKVIIVPQRIVNVVA